MVGFISTLRIRYVERIEGKCVELYKDNDSKPIYESEDSFSDDESVNSVESECSELDNETAIHIYNEFLLEFSNNKS